MTVISQRFHSEKVTFISNYTKSSITKLAWEYLRCKDALEIHCNRDTILDGSQSHIHLTVFCVALSYNRPPPSVGRLTGTCRSKSYHHMARDPPSCGSGRIHTEPTCRRTVRSIHPGNAPGSSAAQGFGGRQGHTTRYIIVNEHVPRRKLLHSATRIPRHYLIAEPPEILELCPRNSECFAPQNIKCQQRSHRPHISHLTQEWEGEEHLKHKRRPQDHRFLADHQSHFYSQNHIKNQGSKGRHSNTRRYGKAKQDDGEGETDDLASKFRTSVKEEDGLQLCSVHRSPVRPRPLKTTKIRTKPETPQTESDSASPGSSSDQHHSSTDQYIQVIHNRSEVAQKRSKGSLYLNLAESHDLVCSNV